MRWRPDTSDAPPLVLGYTIIDPETEAPLEERAPEGRIQRAERILTWAIVAICLALWAVVGFFFWVPLLFRSLVRLTLALIQSMLQGTRPVEAGLILNETVEFYRRGFLIAIGVVFGDPLESQASQRPKPQVSFVTEIGWALLIWYGVLLVTGVVETTPADLWAGIAEYPGGETIDGLMGEGTGAVGGVPTESPAP